METTQFDYQLQGVVSHIGTDATSGHYVTFICTLAGWILFDDSSIRQVSETKVLRQEAYILFYQKNHNKNDTFVAQVVLIIYIYIYIYMYIHKLTHIQIILNIYLTGIHTHNYVHACIATIM